MTVRIRAAVNVEDAEYIDRPRWEFNRLLPEGRELIVAVGDLLLMFSEPAARWLLAMLAPLVAPVSEAIDRHGGTTRTAYGTPAEDDIRVRVHIAVRVYHPAEVGRPRWERCELVVTIGGVVLIFSEAAARRFLKVLTAILPPERKDAQR